METINKTKLNEFINAFIIYEIAVCGVDPRETLDGSTFRIDAEEGYKQALFDKYHELIEEGGSYLDTVMKAISGGNLVDYHQNIKLMDLPGDKKDRLEDVLASIYESDDDEYSFSELIDTIGGNFDIVAFIFFLKDCGNYLPIRSQLFDDNFALLDLKSNLAGHCTWEKYLEFIGWIKEVQEALVRNINDDITLLDAHSFIWILPEIEKYMSAENRVIEHENYGKGIIEKYEKDLIYVRFGKQVKSFPKDSKLLKIVPMDFDNNDVSLPEEIEEELCEKIVEGAKKQITVNAYERDPKAIRKCKNYYLKRDGRLICQICGFDFAETYGPEFANKIEIHHIKPLHEIQEEYEVDPIRDLIPVCPNCHTALHAQGTIGIEELKEKIREQREKSGR